jgi:hypothetical protein
MANDTEECQTLVTMMKTSWKLSTCTTIFHRAKLTPAARVQDLPLLRLNFDVRLVGSPIPVHQLSIGPERSTTMSAHEFMNLPATIQHQKTLLEQLFTRERSTADYERHAGYFSVDGAGKHSQGRIGKFKLTEHKGWGVLHTNAFLYEM